MYELIRAGENTYYIDCPSKMGIYLNPDHSIYLIDSGNDKEAGRKILKIINEQGWSLKGIINTHSNPDHVGGNEFLQKRTGCPVYAKGIEGALTKFPELETAFFYGGYPMKELRNKMLLAKESDPTEVTHPDFPKELEILPLEGHFFEMIGIRTPDEVVFLADALFSEEIISKYHIFFMYDVQAFLDTIERIKEMKAKLFVPSHGPAMEDIVSLAQVNKDKVMEILRLLEELCQNPLTFEEILQKVFYHYDLTMDLNQHFLVGSSIRSYLSYMKDRDKITFYIEENKLYWKTL